MQVISWTAGQAATMAQVIPVIALALGLEMREVRKFFDDQVPETASGKHAIDNDNKDRSVATQETDEDRVAKEFLLRRYSRYVMIGFWGCLAMIILLVGEQSSIAIVLGRSSYNNLNIESLGLRAALAIVFLSPVAQIVLSFMELSFRQHKTRFRKRYQLSGAAIVIMTAVAFSFVYRGY